MADFTFRISPNIMLGSYTTSRMGQFVLEYGNRVMLIIDPILKENGVADKIKQSLSDRQIDFFVFDEISEGATSKNVEAAVNIAKDAHVQSVVAAGGGKTLCIARAVASVLNDIVDGGDFYDFVDGKMPSKEPVPLICVPTSIRDLFVFTNYIPVIDSRSSKIKLMNSRTGLCKLVIFDPNLNVTLSQNQIDSMSIEIIGLVIESYLSQKTNFFSEMLCEKAAVLMRNAIDGGDSASISAVSQEELLAQCGCIASLAVGTSSIGTASLLSLCINSRFKIPRSILTAILLPYVIADAANFKLDKVAKISRLLGVASDSDDDEQVASVLSETIRQKIAKANLPARLKELNLQIEQLALSVEDASSLEFVNTLPRSMNSDNLFELIKTAY
ncbi:MAG: iron-containing alcohol dehydrogenase [Treponema sp.]|nr:iron-containing alcohol dehydrogenase [Treponema sp.]